jgi:hypothetical protein
MAEVAPLVGMRADTVIDVNRGKLKLKLVRKRRKQVQQHDRIDASAEADHQAISSLDLLPQYIFGLAGNAI